MRSCEEIAGTWGGWGNRDLDEVTNEEAIEFVDGKWICL